MKLSHSKTASRRAHHRAGVPSLVTTATGVRRRHFVDPVTGMYRGKQIIAVGTPTEAKPSKRTKKEVKAEKPAKKGKAEEKQADAAAEKE